tara:strand:- start:1430 stop:1762 length:333 start_codon:yes stop_codon:yes gene_type:complete
VALGLNSAYEVTAFADLTAVGVTSSVLTAGVNLLFQITVSSIGTNVKFRLEGSLDDTNFFNLDDEEQDIQVTADGTYGYCLNGCPTKYVRVRLVSISGGTPTLSSKVGAA